MKNAECSRKSRRKRSEREKDLKAENEHLRGNVPECCVCMEALTANDVPTCVLSCGHVFHEHCVREFWKTSATFGAAPSVCSPSVWAVTRLPIERGVKCQPRTRAMELFKTAGVSEGQINDMFEKEAPYFLFGTFELKRDSFNSVNIILNESFNCRCPICRNPSSSPKRVFLSNPN